MKKIIVKHWRLLLAAVAFLVGSKVFNHVNPWLGIAIIVAAVIYIIYELFKFSEDETEF